MTDFTQKRTKPAKAQGYQKREVGKNVYDLALERIRYVYDLFDTIAVSFSGGKDSITGDAKVWIKVDGVLVYTTIATLVDDYVIIGEVENQDDGSMIIYPANRIEIPSATSTGQIDAKVEFFPTARALCARSATWQTLPSKFRRPIGASVTPD